MSTLQAKYRLTNWFRSPAPASALSDPAPDPYLDAKTGILRNLVAATTPDDLARAEADLYAARTVQLLDHQLVDPTRDSNEIRGLHAHLFQDLFDWAGTYRVIDMRRGSGQFFAPFSTIPHLIDSMCATLYECDNLKQLSHTDFIKNLADFYDQLNFIHPFREGNGRTQRFFWSRLAFDAGWILDWRPVQGHELNEASRLARETGDCGQLNTTLGKCVTAKE